MAENQPQAQQKWRQKDFRAMVGVKGSGKKDSRQEQKLSLSCPF